MKPSDKCAFCEHTRLAHNVSYRFRQSICGMCATPTFLGNHYKCLQFQIPKEDK